MVHRWTGIAIAALVAALSGCGREVTRPAVTNVQFSLSASPETGSPSSPVTVSAQVSNAGATRVWHYVACGGDNTISVEVLGPDGRRVVLDDPKAVGPACPPGMAPLEPGGTLAGGSLFTGVLYEQDSPVFPTPTYPAAPGTYSVIARFSYRTTGPWDGPSVELERQISFAWQH